MLSRTDEGLGGKFPIDAEKFEAQKMEALERLAGAVTHEVNNLLMGIAGCADIALAKIPPDNAAARFVAEIRAAALEGSALPKKLLAFSRKRDVIPSVIDLNQTILAQEHMIRHVLPKRINVVVALNAVDAHVCCDVAQLSQSLAELASNACEATPEGGSLTIETHDAGELVVLTVTDGGRGMDDHTRARAVEPYFTTKTIGSGAGLGLSFVYAFAKQSRARLELDSEPGRGTCVRIYFPRASRLPEKPHSETLVEPRGGETVLLVEDVPIVRAPVRAFLERRGYVVLEAGNGEEALRLARASTVAIDVLLTDMLLPGMSGPEIAEEVEKLMPDVRVIYMSASFMDDALVERAELVRGQNYIEKPFDEAALATFVLGVLSRPKARR